MSKAAKGILEASLKEESERKERLRLALPAANLWPTHSGDVGRLPGERLAAAGQPHGLDRISRTLSPSTSRLKGLGRKSTPGSRTPRSSTVFSV